MKKRILKIISLCLALTLIGLICFFANSLVGNPISKLLATKTAKEYIALELDGTDYELSSVSYNFKDGGYLAHIKSPSGIDDSFTLHIKKTGKIYFNDYEIRVLQHSNTAYRLIFEYREVVDSVFTSSFFPYKIEMCYGDLEFQRSSYKPTCPDALKTTDLVNNKLYDVKKLGATNGELVLYVNDDDVSVEKAAEILLCAKNLAQTADISFYTVSFCLQHSPYDTVTYKRPEGRVYISSMLFSEIYEEDLTERIAEYINESKQNEYEYKFGIDTSTVTD